MIHYTDSFPGRALKIKGENYLYFGGTAYLGLQTDPNFQQIYIDNIKKYGSNYGASRKSNLRLSIFETAEKKLAELVGSDACISVSSGYLAGQFIAHELNTDNHCTFYAPNAHSALNVAQIKPYESYEALNQAVRNHLLLTDSKTPVVYLDSLDFSGLSYPDFQGLRALPLDKIIIVIDDSHGFGILEDRGAGVFQKLAKLSPKELIVCCSLGKGFSLQAGAIFGTYKRIEAMRSRPLYGGASPPTAAAMATFVDAFDLFEQKRAQLKENIKLFNNQTEHLYWLDRLAGHPSFGFTDNALNAYLEKSGIIITNFNYPDKTSATVSRIVISAHHLKADIEKLVAVLTSYEK